MGITQINVRMEEELKNEVHSIYEDMGITPSQAINSFYQYVRDNGTLPYKLTISIENVPDTKKTVFSAMNEVQNMMNNALNGLNNTGFFSEENKRAMQFSLNSFTNAFESRYNELKATSGGHLDPAWMTAVNLSKALYYQLAFSKQVAGGWVPLSGQDFAESMRELNQCVRHLQDNDNPFLKTENEQ